jgi:hypothetical protein
MPPGRCGADKIQRRWRQFLESLKGLSNHAQADGGGWSQTRLSYVGIHDGDPPLLHQEDIGQPRQKGGFPGVWGTKEQDRTSLSEVIQRGLPTRLLYKPRHRLYLSISRADDVPPGPRLPQYSLLLDAPLRRSRHQPPHRHRRDLFGGRPTRHGGLRASGGSRYDA